jgi:hypothetical protein
MILTSWFKDVNSTDPFPSVRIPWRAPPSKMSYITSNATPFTSEKLDVTAG